MRLWALLLLASLAASPAAAQGPIALHVVADSEHTAELQVAREALERVLGPTAPLRWTCGESVDAGCIRSVLAQDQAARLVVARVAWERGPCVPMRGPNGEITGRRMLRTLYLRFELYGSDGILIDSESMVIRDGYADPVAAEARARSLLGLP